MCAGNELSPFLFMSQKPDNRKTGVTRELPIGQPVKGVLEAPKRLQLQCQHWLQPCILTPTRPLANAVQFNIRSSAKFQILQRCATQPKNRSSLKERGGSEVLVELRTEAPHSSQLQLTHLTAYRVLHHVSFQPHMCQKPAAYDAAARDPAFEFRLH